MARRTVTATFAGGMISDEPKPGTARYLENLVPRVDGVVPPNPARIWSRAATAISTANGITTASIVGGWSGGGTIHPTLGFVGLLDVSKATSTTASTTANIYSYLEGFGLGAQPQLYGNQASGVRCLMRSSGVESASSFSNIEFADQGGFTPLHSDSVGFAMTTSNWTTPLRGEKLSGAQVFVNTEDEVLIASPKNPSDQAANSPVYRYAGATAVNGVATGVTDGLPTSSILSVTGWAAPTETGTGTAGWTSDLVVTGSAANVITSGMYVSLLLGNGHGTTSISTSTHATREFRIKSVGTLTGTGSTATRPITIDRRIQFSAATRYARCVVSNTAQLQSPQIDRTVATQPFATCVPATGFSSGDHNPQSHGGACYHQGRLFTAKGSRVYWSGTVDETLQMTATGLFGTATDSTSISTAASATYGIEYSHISLYSANSYVDVFPSIGGNIVGLVSMGDGLVVLKRGCVFRIVGGVSYDGETDAFDIQIVSNSTGPESPLSWATTPAGIVFTWNDGIWMFDGNEISEISRGSIANSFVENVRMHRQSNTGLGQESVATRVCTDGDNVFFTPTRYSMSTASAGSAAVEPAFTTTAHGGMSIYNKHLVLSLRDQKWFYISNIYLNVPSAVLPIRSSRGGKYSSYWLNSWKRTGFTESQSYFAEVHVNDIHNMLHEAGPSLGTQSGTTAWSLAVNPTLYSAAVSHPLLGMGNTDTIRPRSALLKRTVSTDYNSTSTSTSRGSGKITLLDSEASFVPASSGFMTYYGSTGVISGIPEWWTSMSSASTAADRSSLSTSTANSPRAQWQVEGTSTTGAANSLLDRFPIENNDSAMSAPTIFYYDDYYWRDKESSTVRFQKSILHSVGIEFDEVENRTDR